MNTKLLVGGIIMILFNAGALLVWWYSFKSRESSSIARMSKYQTLWFALLGLVVGISFVIVAIFGE